MKGTKVKMDTKNKQWWQIETDIECELLNVNHQETFSQYINQLKKLKKNTTHTPTHWHIYIIQILMCGY